MSPGFTSLVISALLTPRIIANSWKEVQGRRGEGGRVSVSKPNHPKPANECFLIFHHGLVDRSLKQPKPKDTISGVCSFFFVNVRKIYQSKKSINKTKMTHLILENKITNKAIKVC